VFEFESSPTDYQAEHEIGVLNLFLNVGGSTGSHRMFSPNWCVPRSSFPLLSTF